MRNWATTDDDENAQWVTTTSLEHESLCVHCNQRFKLRRMVPRRESGWPRYWGWLIKYDTCTGCYLKLEPEERWEPAK